MSKTRVRHIAAIVSLTAFSLPAQGHKPPAKAARIEVQGHRGARARRPENTLPAFEYALKQGVDVLELDVQITRDERLAVMHDGEVNHAICERPGHKAEAAPFRVREHTYEELRAFDCGSRRNPRFATQVPVPGTRVPTLEEVFALVKGTKSEAARRVRFNIETKRVPGDPHETVSAARYAELVVGAVKKAGLVSRVVIQSFDHAVLKKVHALEPRLKLAALLAESRPDVVAVAKAAGAHILSPHQHWITKADVEACHAAGIEVIPWTANTPAEWDRLIALGVDGIISDDPAALIRYMRERGRARGGR